MWPWSLEDRLQRLEARDDEKREENKRLSESISQLRIEITSLSSSIKLGSSGVLLERIEALERRFSSLHEMLVTKSPATGEPQLSKTGRMFKKLFNH